MISTAKFTAAPTVREQLQTARQTAAADLTAAAHLCGRTTRRRTVGVVDPQHGSKRLISRRNCRERLDQSADKRERRVRCLCALCPYLGLYYWQLFKSYISLPVCRIVSRFRGRCQETPPYYLSARTLTGRLGQWRIFQPYQMWLKQRRWCSNYE